MSNAKVKNAKSKEDIWYKILTIAIIALVVLGALIAILRPTGVVEWVSLHTQTAMESENYSVNNAEMTYLVYSLYNNYYNQYAQSGYAEYAGFDSSLPLSQQKYWGNESTSWRDQLISEVKTSITECLTLCESAKAAGVELDEDDIKTIDDEIDGIKDYAKENKMSTKKLIHNMYGSRGITLSDIRSILEKQALASKYAEQITDGFTYTDSDYEEKFNKDKNDYQLADYYKYEVKADYEEDASDEQKSEANKKAETAANALKDAIAGGKSFAEAVYDYEQTLEKDEEDEESTTEETEEKSRDELIKELDEELLQKEQTYTEDDLGKWIFAETAPAENDLKVISTTDTYTVYQVVKLPYRLQYASINVDYLAISSSDFEVEEETSAETSLEMGVGTSNEPSKKLIALEEAIAALKAQTDKTTTREEFLAVADTFEAEYKVTAPDAMENLIKGTDLEGFDDWAFAEDRKVGDMKEFVDENSGAYVFYYNGTGLDAWKVAVDNDLREADYDEYIKEQQKTYTITTNDKAVNKVAA